jgi:hypothetical protein
MDYPPVTEEGLIVMTTQKQNIEKEGNNGGVTPAGGTADAEVVSDFVKALRSNRGEIERSVTHKDSYGRIALEVAIPTVIIVGGVVGMTALCTIIDNKWGNGARANALIDKGVLNNVRINENGEVLTVAAG